MCDRGGAVGPRAKCGTEGRVCKNASCDREECLTERQILHTVLHLVTGNSITSA